MTFDPRVFEEAMAEIRRKSRLSLYQTDFDAWSSDVLGRRYYERFRQVNAEIIERKKKRFAIKSANGCGKSMWLADWETFWVTAFPPEDSLVLATANGRLQIQTVIFKYLKDNYGYMNTQARANKDVPPPIGWINESLEWKYQKPDGSGNAELVIGKRPADQDIVSSFQGTRKLRTFVGMDEAGGLPTELFTAAEAVLTAKDSVLCAIGNPDRRSTEFHSVFTDETKMKEWSRHTISAYDLPTITGEIVYPNDPEKQARMLGGLTAADWIFNKERMWKVGGEVFFDEAEWQRAGSPEGEEEQYHRNTTGKPNARFLAKVEGEFPGETDNSFFPEEDLDKAYELELPETGEIVIGADIAEMGDDESVVYVNQGGRIRLFDKTISYDDGGEIRQTSGVWDKQDTITSARRIHAIATYLGATEVRLDAAGIGAAVATNIMRLPDLQDRCYGTPVKISGGRSSNDVDRWQLWRDEIHDALREQMHAGLIDLDPGDKQLREELLLITYELNNRGAVKITPKRKMRSALGGSPDRADAVMYAAIGTDALTKNELAHLQQGEVVTVSPWDMLMQNRSMEGYPL